MISNDEDNKLKTNIRIAWDGNQWTHMVKRGAKKGEMYWVAVRWYGKILHACEDLLEREA